MSSVFTGLGFKRYNGNPAASDLVRGDIVLFEGDPAAGTGHVELYLGDGMLVGAHINEFGGVAGGQPGDQTGNEISTGGYYTVPADNHASDGHVPDGGRLFSLAKRLPHKPFIPLSLLQTLLLCRKGRKTLLLHSLFIIPAPCFLPL